MTTLMILAVQVAVQAGDARATAEKAILRTRSQGSYETTFKGRLAIPGSAAMDYKGRTIWVAPDVLYIHYTASGGKEDWIVRAGTRNAWVCCDESDKAGPCPRCRAPRTRQALPNVWTYGRVVGWLTAEEAQKPALARGIQNPDEILSVMSRHLDGARFSSAGVVEVSITGKDIQEIMSELAPTAAFDWDASSATLRLEVDGENRLKNITCDVSLVSTDPAVGVTTYTAEVKMVSWNATKEMKFIDNKKKPIKLDGPIKKAIAETLKSKSGK